ncbi:PorV/PorQ family protein [bacterium]|jgi:hypothetical protein|nr:PorV/PorQ family protein [bacterium]
MRYYKPLLAAILILSTIIAPVSAESNAAAFLDKSSTARAASLGMAYVAIANDNASIYLNPAGLSNYKGKFGLHAMVFESIETTYSSVEYIQDFVLGSKLGIGYIGARIDGAMLTSYDDSSNQYVDTGESFGYTGDALHLTLSKQLLKKLHVGVTAKAIRETLFNSEAFGVGADVGVLYIHPKSTLQVGATLRNAIAPQLKWDTGTTISAPQTLAVGASYRLLKDQLLVSAELQKQNDLDPTLHIGSEYFISPSLPIRAGINDKDISLGVGVIVDALLFDYALLIPNDGDIVGNESRFSIGLNL